MVRVWSQMMLRQRHFWHLLVFVCHMCQVCGGLYCGRVLLHNRGNCSPVICKCCHKVFSSLPVLQCFAQVHKSSWWTHMGCGRGWACIVVCHCAALQTDKCDWFLSLVPVPTDGVFDSLCHYIIMHHSNTHVTVKSCRFYLSRPKSQIKNVPHRAIQPVQQTCWPSK